MVTDEERPLTLLSGTFLLAFETPVMSVTAFTQPISERLK